MIQRCLKTATCLAAATGLALPGLAVAQRATILGEIIVRSSGAPIGYAVVGAKPDTPDRFTDANGRFVLRDIKPGKLILSAKHVGYAPFDTTFDVAAGDSVRIRIELSAIAIQLPAANSLGQGCAHPGGPTASMSAELAMLFDQVKQNADRNRLLSTSYPFEVVVQRKISRPEPALEARFVAYDTVVHSSDRAWRYKPGNMMGTREIESGAFGGQWLTITMPELADFGDERFLENHCFDFVGVDVVDGDSLLRLDFTPAPTVHTPDVGGSIYLDPKTFQLRVTMVSLVNLTKQLRSQISGQSIRVRFKEAIPGVPVIDALSSVVFPRDGAKDAASEPSTEDQRAIAVRFLKAKP
jgi:hypothetical protein